MYVYRNIETPSCNHCYSGKAIGITYSGCVFVALGIQHAMRMPQIVICGLSVSTVIFYIISLTARLKKMYVLIFSSTFDCNISHSKKKWARYDKNIHIGLHVKCPLFLSDFNETWILSTDFRKILKYQISWKSVQWEPSCSMRTDRQTDMTNLIAAFHNFTNAPKT